MNRRRIEWMVWIGMMVLSLPGRCMTPTPTPCITPTMAPTFTPTCAPCVTEITLGSIDITDDIGSCFDGDDLADRGETIGITVRGDSSDSCCWGPGSRTVTAVTGYPWMTYLGYDYPSGPQSMSFEYIFYFSVDSGAECMDSATIQIDAYATDGYVSDTDHAELDLLIEVDHDGHGGYECDDYPCGDEPTPTPVVTATPTPTGVPPTPTMGLGATLVLNQSEFVPGDRFDLDAMLSNPGEAAIPGCCLAVVLEIDTRYYWLVECEPVDLPPGAYWMDILMFTWPETDSEMADVRIMGAVLNADLSAIVGTISTVTFGWHR